MVIYFFKFFIEKIEISNYLKNSLYRHIFHFFCHGYTMSASDAIFSIHRSDGSIVSCIEEGGHFYTIDGHERIYIQQHSNGGYQEILRIPTGISFQVFRSDGSIVNCNKGDDGRIYTQDNGLPKQVIILRRSSGEYQMCDAVYAGLFVGTWPFKTLSPHVIAFFTNAQTGEKMSKQISHDIFEMWNGCTMTQAIAILA